MKIPVALLADEANLSQDGKLNVMGAFDRIAAGSFPVLHPKMVFVFRVHSDAEDAGRQFPVRVRLLDEAGDALFEADGEVTAPPVPPGDFATLNQVFALVGMQFPREGLYRFVVRVGAEEAEAPFVVQGPGHDPTLN